MTSNLFVKTGSDEIYNAIREEINPRCKRAKVFIESLWKKVNPFLDSDFSSKLPNEFHQRLWELYMAASVLESGLQLVPRDSRRNNAGPDICIKTEHNKRIWIEVVTASAGNGADAVQGTETGIARDVPDDQIKLRLLNSFDEKYRKYKQYLKDRTVEVGEAYIIALNAARIPSANLEREIPRIVRALLPFGYQILHFDTSSFKIVDSTYGYQGAVEKLSGTKITTTSFLNPDYSGISAVIYSCVDVFNYPSELSSSLLLFRNPLSNLLPLGLLKKGVEYWVEGTVKRSNCSLKRKSWSNNHTEKT